MAPLKDLSPSTTIDESAAERQKTLRLLDYFVNLVYKVVAMTDPANLGEFEQLVLLSVLRAGRDDSQAASGAAIARELEEQAGRRVSRGALYTTLDRLESKGLLRWKIATGGPERGALPRRAYVVTTRGLDAVRGAQRTLQRMWRGLDHLLKERW